jgi:hypothetical protein
MKKLPAFHALVVVAAIQSSQGTAQTACVTFENVNISNYGASNEIIYSESNIDFRFVDGMNGPAFSEVHIGPLPAWTGSYGNDNFSGSKIQWAYATTHLLFNQLPEGFKTITFDYNAYDGQIIMEPIQVWSQGAYDLSYDTTSLTHGGIVTITGYIDSLGIGASMHNDYVVDNICVQVDGMGGIERRASAFSLYPNPTSGQLFITSPTYVATSFRLINSHGQLLQSERVASAVPWAIDLSPYPSGVYFVQLLSDNQSITQRVYRE